MSSDELKLVYAGAAVNGTLINAIVRAFTLALELGRALGSSIRSYVNKDAC